MDTTRALLLWVGLWLAATGCNCGASPTGDDAGVIDGGGPAADGGEAADGGGMSGSDGGARVGPDVAEFSSAAGRVSHATGLTADIQLGIAPARLRASGGAITLEGSAVLQP
ncbi:MAG: hypothetical protein AB1730_24880 [Myxococcota bacterium]|jgi:hypothetical protein